MSLCTTLENKMNKIDPFCMSLLLMAVCRL